MSFHAIRVSGGILTEEFLKTLTEPEALKELGLSPEEVRERFYTLLGLYERLPRLYELKETSKAREAWLLPFFRALGWRPAYNRGHVQVADQSFPISHRGFEAEDAPPLHLVAAEPDVRPSRREKSPQALLQAYLNLHPEQDWGILASPWEVRLLRKYYHVSTPGYVAFNLVELFEAPRDQGLREFQALLLLLSPGRFQKGKDGKTPLDRYYERARETGIRARDALRKGVVEALGSWATPSSPRTCGKGSRTPSALGPTTGRSSSWSTASSSSSTPKAGASSPTGGSSPGSTSGSTA